MKFNKKTGLIVTSIALGIFLLFIIFYIFYRNPSVSDVSQKKSETAERLLKKSGLFMIGHSKFREGPDDTREKPLLLYIDTDDSSINEVNVDNLNCTGIHDAKPFMMNGEYKIVLGTYIPLRIFAGVAVLGGKNMLLDTLTAEFEDKLADQRVRAVSVGDIDADGKEEIVVGTRPRGILKYYKFVDGEWLGTTIDKLNITIHDLLITDSDEDGKNEIVITTSMVEEDFYEEGKVEEGKLKEAGSWAREPAIFKYEFDKNKWNKETIWKFEGEKLSQKTNVHPRYLFGDDFDGDGRQEMVTISTSGNLIIFKWNGQDYSEELIEDDVKLRKDVITYGDVDNDGKKEIIALSFTDNTLLLYQWEKGEWRRSILTKDLSVKGPEENEEINSVVISDSSSGGYKKILYTTESSATDSAGNIAAHFTDFYLLEYEPLKDVWNRKHLGELKFFLTIWGAFPALP